MRMRARQDVSTAERLVGLVIVVVAVAFLVGAFNYRGFAREMPIVLGIPTLVLAVLNLARMFVRVEADLPAADSSPGRPSRAGRQMVIEPTEERSPAHRALPLVSILVMAGVWWLFGALPALFLAMLALPMYYERTPLRRALVIAAIVTLVFSGLVHYGFNFDVLDGVVWS
jgi:hypothetical protein